MSRNTVLTATPYGPLYASWHTMVSIKKPGCGFKLALVDGLWDCWPLHYLRFFLLMFLIFAITQLLILALYHSFRFISTSPFRCTLVPCQSLQMDYSDFSTTSDLWDIFRWPISWLSVIWILIYCFNHVLRILKFHQAGLPFYTEFFLISHIANYFIL